MGIFEELWFSPTVHCCIAGQWLQHRCAGLSSATVFLLLLVSFSALSFDRASSASVAVLDLDGGTHTKQQAELSHTWRCSPAFHGRRSSAMPSPLERVLLIYYAEPSCNQHNRKSKGHRKIPANKTDGACLVSQSDDDQQYMSGIHSCNASVTRLIYLHPSPPTCAGYAATLRLSQP